MFNTFAGNEKVDHLQMQKLEKIVETLVQNGYYRAEVPALSMFDRVRACGFFRLGHLFFTFPPSVLEVSAGQSLQVTSLWKLIFFSKRTWTSDAKCL